jgi:hypothetical protein
VVSVISMTRLVGSSRSRPAPGDLLEAGRHLGPGVAQAGRGLLGRPGPDLEPGAAEGDHDHVGVVGPAGGDLARGRAADQRDPARAPVDGVE